MSFFRACTGFFKSFACTAILALQFHIVGRSADATFLKANQLEQHPLHDFAGQLKVKWSKNVRDERECPPQILLGCDDPDFCVLLNMACYLESYLAQGNGANGWDDTFLFNGHQDPERAPKLARKNYQQNMAAAMKSPEFREVFSVFGGMVGTHSVRKFASTYARRWGLSSADVDSRGRWKGSEGSNRIVNTSYISPDQPFIDANVASALCLGKPVAYRIHPEAHRVTSAWLQTHVVPHMHQHTRYYSIAIWLQ